MNRNLIRLATIALAAALLSAAGAQTLNSPTHFLATTPTLLPGEAVTGELTVSDGQNFKDGSRVDVYSFVGAAGDQVTLSLGSNDFDTYLTVYDPMLNLFDWNDDAWDVTVGEHTYNSQLDLYLMEDGRYTVIVSGYSNWDLGTYSLEMTATAAPDSSPRDMTGASPLQIPGNAKVNITTDLPVTGDGYAGPSQVYSFSLSEDLLLIIDAKAPEVDTVLLLYTSGMELVDFNDDFYDQNYDPEATFVWHSRIVRELPAGNYFLVLGSFSPVNEGQVELSINAYRPAF